MKTLVINSLAALALSAAFGTALAQEVPPPPPIVVVSGNSGSAGLGIDFAGGQTPGSNHEKGGGFADAIERAFGTPNADCGKLKCD
jgi:opacity protein-like surface antigen